MFFSSAEAKMACGLKVNTNDPGWHKSVTKILSKIKGASYTINAEEGMAYITARADPNKLPRKLKSGKFADICWVKTGNHITYGGDIAYSLQGMTMEQPTYNWQNHYPHLPPPPSHHHHHRLPYYQNPYNGYSHYGYWHI